MIARHISFRLKSTSLADYSRVLKNEIVPLLHKQKGFKDEIALSNPDSVDCIAISLWENQADVDAYNTNVYPTVLKLVQGLVDGTPTVKTFSVVTSSLLNVAKAA